MTNAREGWLDKAGIEHMQRMLEHHDPKNTHTLCRMALSALEQEADYAALKARVEELDHDRIIREAYEAEFGKLDELRERIAKTTDAKHLAQLVTNKARDYAKDERDSLRAEVMEQARLLGISGSREASLRAQLEAAKERCGEHACEKGHWRISYDGDNSDCPLCEAREEVLLLRSQTAKLTAQPDGVRLAAKKLVDFYMDGTDRDGTPLEALMDELDEALGTEALSAAPAREDGIADPVGTDFRNFYDACEMAHRHVNQKSDGTPFTDGYEMFPELGDTLRAFKSTRQALAAPAPAKVCQTCGDEKYVFHELDLSKPCPDCAHEEGKL